MTPRNALPDPSTATPLSVPVSVPAACGPAASASIKHNVQSPFFFIDRFSFLFKVRADPGLIPDWIEETLRFDASSQLIARTLARDVLLHGEVLPKGARVGLLIGSANRDERVFEDPDVFDVTRRSPHSLAFGHGTHFCLGASLARLEGRVALEEIQARLPDFELPPEGLVRVHSSNVRGFAAIPIEFGR